MERETQKDAYETEVFKLFIKKACLNVDVASIQHGKASNHEPDILCEQIGAGKTGFELGRITDSRLRASVNSWNPVNGEYIRTRDRSSEITRKKLNKTYTQEFPIELILYKENPVITPDNVIIPTIKPLCQGSHYYKRIWYMGKDVAVLYEKG